MRWAYVFMLFALLVSCKRKWTEKNRQDFYGGCLKKALSDKEIADPKQYCHCLTQKIVARYPNANDVKYIRYDSTLKKLAEECLGKSRLMQNKFTTGQ